MKTDPFDYKHIIADPGKTLVRTFDGIDFGPEVHLGLRYYTNGKGEIVSTQERAADFSEVRPDDVENFLKLNDKNLM